MSTIAEAEISGSGFKISIYTLRGVINIDGGIAQLVEHLPCKQGVSGSNPLTSTKTENCCFQGSGDGTE